MKQHKETYIEGLLSFEGLEGLDPLPVKKRRGRKPQLLPREERPEMTMTEMVGLLAGITEVEGANGSRYIGLHVTKRLLLGIRESSQKAFSISLENLYAAYNDCHRFTSPEVKKCIYMGHSPALALLRLLKQLKQGGK